MTLFPLQYMLNHNKLVAVYAIKRRPQTCTLKLDVELRFIAAARPLTHHTHPGLFVPHQLTTSRTVFRPIFQLTFFLSFYRITLPYENGEVTFSFLELSHTLLFLERASGLSTHLIFGVGRMGPCLGRFMFGVPTRSTMIGVNAYKWGNASRTNSWVIPVLNCFPETWSVFQHITLRHCSNSESSLSYPISKKHSSAWKILLFCQYCKTQRELCRRASSTGQGRLICMQALTCIQRLDLFGTNYTPFPEPSFSRCKKREKNEEK